MELSQSGAEPGAGQGVAAWLAEPSSAGRWSVDPSGTIATFQVKHLWGALTVRGALSGAAGEVTIDPSGGVTGQLTLQSASVNTEDAKRDAHLRSADFFGVADHPGVKLILKSARPKGNGSLACTALITAGAGSTGVDFTAVIEEIGTGRIALTAEISLDRTERCMTWSPMGMASRTVVATVRARFNRS